jgi:hypothetical protein
VDLQKQDKTKHAKNPQDIQQPALKPTTHPAHFNHPENFSNFH